MTQGESLPHNGGEELPLPPNELIGETIPVPYAEAFILRVLDESGGAGTQLPEGFKPPRIDIELSEVFSAARISKAFARTAADHREFQDIFRAGYLKLQDSAASPGISPEAAAMLREEAAEIRSLMYYHIHQAFPVEREEHIRETPWPETPGEEAA